LLDGNGTTVSEDFLTAGTTSKTYTSLLAGNYTVKVYDGDMNTCEETFNITIGCPKPTSGFSATLITSTSAKLNWNAVNCSDGYRVQYKKMGSGSWTTKYATANSKNISGLLANTTYQWRVANQCQYSDPEVFSAYSPVQTFTTLPMRQSGSVFSTIEVVPNPTSGIVYIVSSDNVTGIDQIEIFDATGRNMQAEDSIETETGLIIQMEKYPVGMYWIKVYTNNEAKQYKILKL
jgi:hypothetical protein